jgi:plasmid stabilization system protein ParE
VATTVLYSAGALADIARLGTLLIRDNPSAARSTAAVVMNGIEVLKTHPLVGRIVTGTLRELIISRGRSGYVALYEYQSAFERVLVVAIRHQREAPWLDLA